MQGHRLALSSSSVDSRRSCGSNGPGLSASGLFLPHEHAVAVSNIIDLAPGAILDVLAALKPAEERRALLSSGPLSHTREKKNFRLRVRGHISHGISPHFPTRTRTPTQIQTRAPTQAQTRAPTRLQLKSFFRLSWPSFPPPSLSSRL